MKTIFLLFLSARACAADADLVLHNGKVFINRGVYAQAVATLGNRIVKAGPEREVMAFVGLRTRVIDLKGRAVTPGFHDAHIHFIDGALSLARGDLFGSASVAQAQDKLRAFLATGPMEEWVQGRGWDRTILPKGRYPTRQDLDVVVSTRPVVLTGVDGDKILWANSMALRLAGITAATPDPIGGGILRDSDGEPAGILTGEGAELMEKAVPLPSPAVKKAALRKALALARESGVTAIQGQLDATPEEELQLWKELLADGEVTLRYFLWGEIDHIAQAEQRRRALAELGSDRLRLGGLQGVLDGAIGARTAALLAPYSDAPEEKGRTFYTRKALKALVEESRNKGFQAVLHAAGDAAVRLALDACSGHNASSGTMPSCKIEHMELVSPRDVLRLRKLGVVASLQPSRMTRDHEDQNDDPKRLGDRVKYAFPWRSMLKAGAIEAFGTDWPATPLHPRVALFSATTRQHFDGSPAGGWIPEQKLTMDEAVYAYTAGSAQAIRRGKDLGTIGAGRMADLVVWNSDLFSLSGQQLLKAEVDMTIFDGRVVFDRKSATR